MQLLEADSQSFRQEVLSSPSPVLAEFTADWCTHCQALAPVVERLAQELEGSVKVVKVDVDKSQDVAAAYRVMSVPTLMVFQNGEATARSAGARSRDQILQMLKE